MNKIDVSLKQLLNAVKDSNEYKEYEIQLERVRQYPELKQQIDEFRKKNFELQNSPDYKFEKLEEFAKQYAAFREDPLVSDFLAAELAFCRLMQRINLQLTDALNFE